MCYIIVLLVAFSALFEQIIVECKKNHIANHDDYVVDYVRNSHGEIEISIKEQYVGKIKIDYQI